MRLQRQAAGRRLGGDALIGIIIAVTVVAGGVGILVSSLAAAAPPSAAAALAVGKTASFNPAGQVVTSFATVPVPAGYTATSSDGSVVLAADGGRERIVVSQIDEPSAIDLGVLTENIIDDERATIDSNAKICADEGTDTATFTLNGGGQATGTYLPLCDSVAPQNSTAFTARSYYYAALAQAGGHPVALVVQVFGSTSRFPAQVAALAGFVPAISWNAAPAAS